MKMDLFLQIEKKYGLLNDTVEGMYYWNLNRYDIFQYRIVEKKLSLSPAHSGKKKTIKDRLMHKVMLLYYSTFFNKIPRQGGEVCFVNHPRRVKMGEVYECIYTEKLAQYFTNSVVLEKPYLDGHLRPVKTKNLVYTDRISLLAMKQLKKIKKTIYYQEVRQQIFDKLKEPLTELAGAYEVEIDIQRTVDFCTEKAILCSLKKPYFKSQIQKINPKVIVEVVYYNRDCMVINEVAKELSIPVIELQHGTMGEIHSAYQFAEGIEFLHLPDKILTFSEFWNQMVNIPQKTKRLIAVGYPYFEEQIKKYGRNTKIENGPGRKQTIMFVSQGTVSKELSKFAVDFADCTGGQVRIIYKLHPSEYGRWREECPWLEHSAIEVIDHSQKSIYAYFAESDVQVGVYSTAIYEGMAFDIKTCIYDTAMADTMYSLCEGDYATLVKTPEDLLTVLNADDNRENTDKSFWKEDSFNHIKEIIQEYIQG